MLELTREQVAVLEGLVEAGFRVVAFPLYESKAGVRRGECGALLTAVEGAGMEMFGDVFWIVGGQPAVKVKRGGREIFVFKKTEVEVTVEREEELRRFRAELGEVLGGVGRGE